MKQIEVIAELHHIVQRWRQQVRIEVTQRNFEPLEVI